MSEHDHYWQVLRRLHIVANPTVFIILNIALLLIGTTATLAAFGGKTWQEGSDPAIKRVTFRGWVSLGCLFAALALGTIKEIQTQKDTKEKEKASRNHEDYLSARNAELKGELDVATRGVSDTNERLADARKTLDLLQARMLDAQNDVDREGDFNLLAAASNAGESVSGFVLFVPLAIGANSGSTFHDVLLPRFSSPQCARTIGVHVSVWTGMFKSEEIEFSPLDSKDRHDDRKLNPSSQQTENDELWHPKNKYEKQVYESFSRGLGMRSSNAHAIFINIRPEDDQLSSAEVLSQLLRSDPVIKSASDTSLIDFEIIIRSTNENPPVSVSCTQEIRRYFNRAFERASFGVTINDKTHLTIYFPLIAVHHPDSEGNPALAFKIDGRPYVGVN